MIEYCKLFANFVNSIYNINLPIFDNNIKLGTLFLGSIIVFLIIKKVLEVGDKK